MKSKQLLVKAMAVFVVLSGSSTMVDAKLLPKHHGRRSGVLGKDRQILADCPNKRAISSADGHQKAVKKRPYWWRKKR